MSAKCYSLTAGSVECAVLLDGASEVGVERMLKRFPNGSEADYRQAYTDLGLSLDEADSSLNILLVKTGGETILIDAGEGGRPRGGCLPDSLRLVGLEPDAVTQVVITHTHGDHVQGLISDAHEPVFPNASYVISKAEMAFWQTRIGGGAAADQRPIAAMMEAQGLRCIDMDEVILPGLTAVPIPGHTPGQIAVLLESESEKLIHLADLLHSPMQFAHPEWSPAFDADTSQSVPTRRAALARAADEHMLALFYHLTFPGLGRIRQAGTVFIWEPLEI